MTTATEPLVIDVTRRTVVAAFGVALTGAAEAVPDCTARTVIRGGAGLLGRIECSWTFLDSGRPFTREGEDLVAEAGPFTLPPGRAALFCGVVPDADAPAGRWDAITAVTDSAGNEVARRNWVAVVA